MGPGEMQTHSTPGEMQTHSTPGEMQTHSKTRLAISECEHQVFMV